MAKTDYRAIDEYHSAFSGETLRRMQVIRKWVYKVAPGAEEVISYQVPDFKIGPGFHLVYYCAFSKHLTIAGVWSEALLKEFEQKSAAT